VPLFDVLKDWWAREAPYYLLHDVAASSVQPADDTGSRCEAGTHYFRLWLAEMRLARDQSWFVTRHPALHALVHLQFGDEEIDLPRIVGPRALPGLDAPTLGQAIHVDCPLTPLLPYNGGVVEVLAGLVALEGASAFGEVIAAIDAVTQVVAQPPISMAVAAIGPVTRAVEALCGAGNGGQHLGVHVAYAGDQVPHALHAGYLAVVRRDAYPVQAADLSVRQGRLWHGGERLTGADYMLFRIERVAERDDWDTLRSIAIPFRDALTASSHGNTTIAEAHVRRALLEAWTSPDLTRVDRARVCAEIKRSFQQARDLGLGLGHVQPTLADAMAGAVSVERQRQLPTPRLEALMELD
jgi:hypothetical protein